MTNLKVQKLVYYAQAWHLALKNKPLFNEDFQAWVHGPVIPELYFKYKEKGIRGSIPIPVECSFEDIKTRLDSETIDFLLEVANQYMVFNGFALEEMTHQEDPWKIARGATSVDGRSDSVISKDSMRDYYASRITNQAQ